MTREELQDKMKDLPNPPLRVNLIQQVYDIMNEENEELQEQIEKMQDDIDCLTLACENYREEMEKNLADATELEKENAELKERNRELLESCEGATMMYKDLCKAKELLKDWLQIAHKNNARCYGFVKDTEQFLK